MKHALILWLLVVLCGCDSSEALPTPAQEPTATLQVRHVLSRALTPEVAMLEVRLLDVHLNQISEQSFPAQALIEVPLPATAAVVALGYRDATGANVGSFRTTVDPGPGGTIVIDDPAWVAEEPIVYRFAVTGCNRLGFGELSLDNPSSANRAQLLADLTEIPQQNPQPRFLFFAGDLVTNLDPGTATLETQLTAWLELFNGSPLSQSPVALVPFTGNHEILLSRKDPDTGEFVEFPNPATLPVWVNLMEAFIPGADGPTPAPPNADSLIADESRLSYTFQDQDILFVVLNTDTFIDDTTLGDVPLNWLEEQLDLAQNDAGVNHVFVLGHKPVQSPPGADEPPGPGSIRTDEKAAFEQLLAGHSKVRAYLCAHAHLWEHRLLIGGVPQVIAGNAGSQVEPPFDDTGRGYFGYTLVNLQASGAFSIESWGRPIPDPYNAPAPQPPAGLRVKKLLKGSPSV